MPVIIFLGPPAFYIYIRSFVYDKTQLRRIDLLHLIPALLVLINLFPLITSSSEIKSEVFRQIHENS